MCGIIGYSSKENKFDSDKIKFLLYANSIERASQDSVGFYTKDMAEPYKSVLSPKSLIENKSIDSVLIPSTNFIGHVRKTSSGSVTKDNAHPYKINNIIGVHNGTLTGIYNFCNKFNIKQETSKTDSYHLFKAIAKCGNPSPILSAEGSLAILFTDTLEPDVLYVYRNIERPLYYGYINDDMYISSEQFPLTFIGCTNVTLFTYEKLYIIKDGKIQSEIKLEQKTQSFRSNTPSLIGKWVKILEDNFSFDIKGDEFYFVDSQITYGIGTTLTFSKGKSLKTNAEITSKISGVPLKFVDLSLDYDTSLTDSKIRCAKTVGEISFEDGTVLEDSTDILLISRQNDLWNIYVPYLDKEFSRVPKEDFRVCTKKEESEIQMLLESFSEEGGDKILDQIKFSTNLPEEVNKKLSEFNQNLIKSLNELINKKDNQNLQTELTKIIDEAEQFNEQLNN